jgi:hypothetical protein
MESSMASTWILLSPTANLVTFNSYDNQQYVFGKGQTDVTVSAPQTAIPVGTGALIQGTVTDQSPGAEDTHQL